MNKKSTFKTFFNIVFILSFVFSFAQKSIVDEMLVPGPIAFNNAKYTLSATTKDKKKNYYSQTYTLAKEVPKNSTEIKLQLLPNTEDFNLFIKQKATELSATNKDIKVTRINDFQQRIDYRTDKSCGVTFYKKSMNGEEKGIINYSFYQKLTEDSKTFSPACLAFAKTKIPEVKIIKN